jgi:hypothetical protein
MISLACNAIHLDWLTTGKDPSQGIHSSLLAVHCHF